MSLTNSLHRISRIFFFLRLSPMDFSKSLSAPKGFLSRFDSNRFIAWFNMYLSDILVGVAFLLLWNVFFVDFDKYSTLISSNPGFSSSNIWLLPTETWLNTFSFSLMLLSSLVHRHHYPIIIKSLYFLTPTENILLINLKSNGISWIALVRWMGNILS